MRLQWRRLGAKPRHLRIWRGKVVGRNYCYSSFEYGCYLCHGFIVVIAIAASVVAIVVITIITTTLVALAATVAAYKDT